MRRPLLSLRHAAVAGLLASAVIGVDTLRAVPLPPDDPRTVRITKADCARLVKHVPADDVEYTPGVDVRGNPVAPADLYGGHDIELPQIVAIPIEVDLFDRRGRPADRRYQGEVFIGLVEMDLRDGRVYFDGRPITSEAQAKLAARCQVIMREAE